VREGCIPPSTAEELGFGKTVFQHAVHKPNDTGPTISSPKISHRTATIAQLKLALLDVLSYLESSLNSVT